MPSTQQPLRMLYKMNAFENQVSIFGMMSMVLLVIMAISDNHICKTILYFHKRKNECLQLTLYATLETLIKRPMELKEKSILSQHTLPEQLYKLAAVTDRFSLTCKAVDCHSAGVVKAFLAVALVLVQNESMTTHWQTL